MSDEEAVLTTANFIKIALTAVSAALLTLFVTWLKAHRDSAKASVDDFNKVLNDAADLAAEYWLKKTNDDDTPLMEARLIGMQMKVLELSNIAQSSFDHLNKEILALDIADFLDACTGGDFGVAGRPVNTQKARQAQSLCAQISARMLRAHIKSVSLSSYFARNLPFYRW